MGYLLWLLLPIASTVGWVFGRKYALKPPVGKQQRAVPYDYLLGVNYVINEQPDRAVDVFIRMLEVDGDTVETHLALGSLFRRRGEVDRAIRIHQNIIARPQLAKEQRVMALTELGKDYLKAGVLDRAERIFQELVSLGEEMQASLEYLLNIYQQQKDWQQAIHTAQKLGSISRVSMKSNIAQYYCEMAELEYDAGNTEQALHYLKRAASVDRLCVRISLMQSKIFCARGDYKLAISCLECIVDHDPDYICEIIQSLEQCYQAINRPEDFIEYLFQVLKQYPRISIVLVLTDYILKSEGPMDAINFVAEQIRQHPSLRGLERLIDLYLSNSEGDTKSKLELLQQLVNQLLKDKPKYRCNQCGFAGHSLYWHCPGCKHWNSSKPIHGIEGD